MARWILLVLIIAAGAAAFYFLPSEADFLTINWPGSTQPQPVSLLLTVVGLIALAIGSILLWTLLRWLWTLPRRLKEGREQRRRSKGLEAIEAALLANASGDTAKAAKHSARARELLDYPSLGALLSARIAEEAGDYDSAEDHYRLLLGDENTSLAARLGLAKCAQGKGDTAGVIVHAKEAMELSSAARWPVEALFDAYLDEAQWENAADLTARAEKRGVIDKDTARRRRAVLLTAAAADEISGGSDDKAKGWLEQAVADAPAFAPAVVLSAESLQSRDYTSKAESVIEKAWSRAPHPALITAWLELGENKDDKARAKRLRKLARHNRDHPESQIAEAMAALIEKDGEAAMGALAPLLKDKHATQRVCELAARAEALRGRDEDAAKWSKAASTAPIDPDWSDLDPEGPAFRYTDEDWRRLTYSFGDKGEMIHPRYERARRAASILTVSSVPEARQSYRAPSADDPGIEPVEITPEDQVFIGNSEAPRD